MSRGSYWDMPVLVSVEAMIDRSVHVTTDRAAIDRAAGWMAYEEFVFPTGATAGPFALGDDPDHVMDVSMFIGSLNFAFTDFESGVKFEAEHGGVVYSDTEGMFARIIQALDAGTDLLSGEWMAGLTRDELARVFWGNIEMPMLDDRVAILNEIGSTLVDRYGGRFHRFVRDCAPAMYAGGDGLMERMVAEFPRFNDVSNYHGQEVKFFKLAQLTPWSLHMALHASGAWALTDLGHMTAFADYIVPVALRLMGILRYSPELEEQINTGVNIPRDSDEEIEIRAHTLYATALLTDAINGIRPDHLQLVVPQVDYRLWKTYHATFWPHHLTHTIMY